jgi:SPP1 family predicted phage head-tail adaptor
MPGISAIGKLDRRITIQQEVVTTNAYNEPAISSWEDVKEVYASVSDGDSNAGISGKEVFSSDQLTARRIVKFTIRYRRGITEKMRILHDEKYYGIISISEPDRRKSLEIRGMVQDET